MTASAMSVLDRAIAAAKFRAEQKAANGGAPVTVRVLDESLGIVEGDEAPLRETKVKQPKEKKVAKVVDLEALAETKAAAKTAREDAKKLLEQQRLERKAAKAAAKAVVKGAEAPKTPHFSKVAKAFAKLPQLSTSLQSTFEQLVTTTSPRDLATLAAHLEHYNRDQATQKSLAKTLSKGDLVEITGGNAKHVGLVGTVSRVQRIRCYVDVPSLSKEVYCFTADVAPVGHVVGLTPEEVETTTEEEVVAAE